MTKRGIRGLARSGFRIVAALVLAVVIGLGGLALSGRTESWFFYWPSRAAFQTPTGWRDVSIEVEPGITLHAWYMPAQGLGEGELAPVVVHCHGNAGTVEVHEAFSSYLPQHGISVLLFDYRGYGRSTDARTDREALRRDALAAADFARAMPETDPDRVGVLGFSLGGTFATIVASEREWIRGLCVISGFSAWQQITRHYAGPLAPLLIRVGRDSEDMITSLGDRPVLIVHGDADRIVPVDHGRTLRAAAEGAGVQVTYVEVPGAGHTDVVAEDADSRNAVVRFFTDLLSTPE